MKPGPLLFNPAGRIGRRAFAYGALILVVAVIAIAVLLKAGLVVAAGPLALAALYVLICLCAKRLRDIGHSPWLQLLPWALAVIPAFADALMWAGRQVSGLGALAGPLTLSLNLRMLAWFVFVFVAWLGLSRTKTSVG